jgi:hypothetical protein
MELTPKEQADNLWKIHAFYWADDTLEAKQRIVIQIMHIIRTLNKYGIKENDYWEEVKRHIYEME